MKTSWFENLAKNTKNHTSCTITSTAYMNDTTWYALNQAHMQKILNKVTEFFQINDIQANADKSSLICINVPPNQRKTGVHLNNICVTPLENNEAVRVLGVWITGSGSKKFQKNLITSKSKTMLK